MSAHWPREESAWALCPRLALIEDNGQRCHMHQILFWNGTAQVAYSEESLCGLISVFGELNGGRTIRSWTRPEHICKDWSQLCIVYRRIDRTSNCEPMQIWVTETKSVTRYYHICRVRLPIKFGYNNQWMNKVTALFFHSYIIWNFHSWKFEWLQ